MRLEYLKRTDGLGLMVIFNTTVHRGNIGEVESLARFFITHADRIGFASLGSLADRVLNFASAPDVDSVWINGRARKRNGEMIGVNWDNLKLQIDKAQERIGPQAASITFT